MCDAAAWACRAACAMTSVVHQVPQPFHMLALPLPVALPQRTTLMLCAPFTLTPLLLLPLHFDTWPRSLLVNPSCAAHALIPSPWPTWHTRSFSPPSFETFPPQDPWFLTCMRLFCPLAATSWHRVRPAATRDRQASRLASNQSQCRSQEIHRPLRSSTVCPVDHGRQSKKPQQQHNQSQLAHCNETRPVCFKSKPGMARKQTGSGQKIGFNRWRR